jgi:hypothetical protein
MDDESGLIVRRPTEIVRRLDKRGPRRREEQVITTTQLSFSWFSFYTSQQPRYERRVNLPTICGSSLDNTHHHTRDLPNAHHSTDDALGDTTRQI